MIFKVGDTIEFKESDDDFERFYGQIRRIEGDRYVVWCDELGEEIALGEDNITGSGGGE